MRQPWNSLFAILLFVIAASLKSDAQDLSVSAGEDQGKVTEDDPLGLKLIRDDFWLTGNENPAYYGLLKLAQDQSPEELAKTAKEFTAKRKAVSKLPTFVDMIRHPQAFRGKPVHLNGHVLQTIEYDAEENPHGIEQLYEISLFSEDSQTHPTTVVFLEKPESLPVGGETVNGVRVNGYFLKTYLYPSSDNKTRKAPLILARTVEITPQQAAKMPETTNKLIYGVIAGGLLLLVITVILVQRSDRRRMLERQKKQLEENAPEIQL